ncbi:flagellar hook-associated protein FlgK [Aneurinibacillus aneurinilyticus]|uniref:flagellar hook-associated protein FlgK n=1 Tax=Aneurinibacillus aneurinilyticus TaxID=1391 RepID=UPI0035237CD6
MPSTFSGLEIAKRAMFAQQTALYTIGHNIANENTEGYTRQRVNMQATSPYPYPSVTNGGQVGQIGTGVIAGSIQRLRERFLDLQFRDEYKNVGEYGARTDTLGKIETIINEPADEGLHYIMDEFWKGWQKLSGSSNDNAAREVVRQNAVTMADNFNFIQNELKQMQDNLNETIKERTKTIQEYMDGIANYNKQINDIVPHGYVPNDLYDQRDLLLDKLSKLIDIDVSPVVLNGKETGMVDVKLKGSGTYLVNETAASKVTAQPTDKLENGKDKYGVFIQELTPRDGSNPPVTPEGRAAIWNTGKIEALGDNETGTFEFNGVTVNITSEDNPASTEPVVDPDGKPVVSITIANGSDAKATAKAILDALNAYKNDAGTTELKNFTFSGNENGIIITGTKEDGANNNTKAITITGDVKIANNTIDDQLKTKGVNGTQAVTMNIGGGEMKGLLASRDNIVPEYINRINALAKAIVQEVNNIHITGKDKDGNPAVPFFVSKSAKGPNADGTWDMPKDANDIAVNPLIMDNPNKIAAGKTGDASDNSIALAISKLKEKKDIEIKEDGKSDPQITSFDDYTRGIVSTLGQESREAQRMLKSAISITGKVEYQRQSISNVSQDEELSESIKYQHAYNAAARMVTVVDEMLDKIINGMGVVGR